MAGVGDCPRGATGPKPGSLSPGDSAPSGRWARLPGSPRGHRAVTSLGCVPTPSRLTLDYLPDRTPSCSARDAKSPSSRREWSRGTCPVPRRHGGGAPKRPPRTSQPRGRWGETPAPCTVPLCPAARQGPALHARPVPGSQDPAGRSPRGPLSAGRRPPRGAAHTSAQETLRCTRTWPERGASCRSRPPQAGSQHSGGTRTGVTGDGGRGAPRTGRRVTGERGVGPVLLSPPPCRGLPQTQTWRGSRGGAASPRAGDGRHRQGELGSWSGPTREDAATFLEGTGLLAAIMTDFHGVTPTEIPLF